MKKDTFREYHKKESSFASGLFWGAALGAAGIFLFATKKGKKLRNHLKKHGNKILEELEEIYEEAEEKVEAKKLPQPEKKSAAKKKTAKAKTQDLNHIKKLQERGRKAASNFFTRGGKALK
jgi:gas vesicle protein